MLEIPANILIKFYVRNNRITNFLNLRNNQSKHSLKSTKELFKVLVVLLKQNLILGAKRRKFQFGSEQCLIFNVSVLNL